MRHAFGLTIVLLLLTASNGASAVGNLILNGDFETNGASAGVSQVNLSNPDFSALVSFTTAFGNSNAGTGELDLYTTDASYISPPQSGAWQVRLHGDGVNYDAFSLWLSSALVSGATYQLSFHASGLPGINPIVPVSVQIGVSADPASFGTAVYTSNDTNGTGDWHRYDTAFIAPVTGAYLTVRNVSVSAGVDNFTLTPVPEPGTYAMLLAGLGLVGLRLRGIRMRLATTA